MPIITTSLVFEEILEDCHSNLERALKEWNTGWAITADQIQSEVAESLVVLRQIAVHCGSDWRDLRDCNSLEESLHSLIQHRLMFRPTGRW